MNKYVAILLAAVGIALFAQQTTITSDLQASIVFGLMAAGLSRIAIHKVKPPAIAVALLMVLTLFGSQPLKALLNVSNYPTEVALTAAYAAALWCIGQGWKRSWR